MMTEREIESFPIVGSHFHPPAKALLSGLPAGTGLTLVPEPDNPFDGNAVKVVLAGSELTARVAAHEPTRRRLEQELLAFGQELEALCGQDEIHLGYVPRGLAAELAPRLGGRRTFGLLSFGLTGQAQVTVPSQAQQTSEQP